MVDKYYKNPILESELLPVDIVLHPSWWHHHAEIIFDEDFFYHPSKRVEVERKMETILYERWGKFGLGSEKDNDSPEIGPVHLTAGDLISAMLDCELRYVEDGPPQVIVANQERLKVNIDRAFKSPPFKKFEYLIEHLKAKYGYVRGDTNWSGILNIALDVRGQNIFLDVMTNPEEAKQYFDDIFQVISRFTRWIQKETGTTSISVNRLVRHFKQPVFLHSECSHVMISKEIYEKYLMDFDIKWSQQNRPFGIHYCGKDPHRYAEVLSKIPHLDFLDVGWGGNVKKIREHLPHTFLNIRLSSVEIIQQSADEIRNTIIRLVQDSANPWLTGVCCINMDHQVGDEKITTIFETVEFLREEYRCKDIRTEK